MKNKSLFNIEDIPFSRFGSYLAISKLKERAEIQAGIWIRNIHGDAAREVFRIEIPEDNITVNPEIIASPAELVIKSSKGYIRICLSGLNRIRVKSENIGFRLVARPGNYNSAIPQENERWLLNISTAFQNYILTVLKGDVDVDCPWEVARCSHIFINAQPNSELIIDQGVGCWYPEPVTTTYEDDVAMLTDEFNLFVSEYQSDKDRYAETTLRAVYLNWSTVVEPCGLFTRPAMLMSKNHMTNVWSWDHAFNALALSGCHPQLSWDQLMLMFDHQHASGQLPDFMNDILKLYNFVKPPIHGWIFQQMQQHNKYFLDNRIIAELYEPICKWTEWWFTYRNPDGDGLPQYHHGNDSGWDNGTVFDFALPTKGADLTAFLIIQMETISKMAVSMGYADDAEKWQKRADNLLEQMISRFWNGTKFINPSAIDGHISEKSDSIFSCLPVVLGNRLPVEIKNALVNEIRRHLTTHGLATENVKSPLYESDGYWRGPIWAPPTYIIVNGLLQIGENELAKDIAQRFCRLCEKEGFAENYNAITGAALRDKAYTWTSSVFLVLNKILQK